MAKDVNLTFRVTPEYVRAAIMLGRPLLNEYQVLKLIRLEDTIGNK